ncbi:LysM peptidoglycan-binding domain-containing protein [Mycolicibacterium arenosum]|uniref:LysM peptidoglycan-binding domain-containing protein n=1 Tax=Mycolicibacterium arenosum TaxID=2952157 RepID=A0ABT1M7T7_9MYCO|nr:LysM peptidoglycan-binding domain-containing protein [Mycolicibacterium sp. CAU 1645]MCP9275188.1 LysM peptidoglycan-binding domain-containing protein [Mycolicibacterium sp. CAU 1645]
MGDRLEEGQKLLVGNSLTSKNGAYTLTLQQDGNLVLYSGDDAVWSTKTDGQKVERAEVQEDGNFVLYTAEKPVWASQTKGKKKVLLVLQDDRNLVLYSEEGPVWKSDTHTDEAPPAPKAEEPPVVEAEVIPAAAEAPAPEAPAEPAPPPPPPPPPAPPAPRTYTVVSGDTLWAIAEKFYGDGSRYPQIAEASGVPNPDLIHPGQVLTIP